MRRLCTRSQGAKFYSIRIALLLGRWGAAERRASWSNRSEFSQTQSRCRPIGELGQPSSILTRLSPHLEPPCAAVTGVRAAFLMHDKVSRRSIGRAPDHQLRVGLSGKRRSSPAPHLGHNGLSKLGLRTTKSFAARSANQP